MIHTNQRNIPWHMKSSSAIKGKSKGLRGVSHILLRNWLSTSLMGGGKGIAFVSLVFGFFFLSFPLLPLLQLLKTFLHPQFFLLSFFLSSFPTPLRLAGWKWVAVWCLAVYQATNSSSISEVIWITKIFCGHHILHQEYKMIHIKLVCLIKAYILWNGTLNFPHYSY